MVRLSRITILILALGLALHLFLSAESVPAAPKLLLVMLLLALGFFEFIERNKRP